MLLATIMLSQPIVVVFADDRLQSNLTACGNRINFRAHKLIAKMPRARMWRLTHRCASLS
jgi:hypothetical protein